MPPRYAYWTILVDDQPTAFRAGSQEDLMPTFKRLKDKQPTAKMMWFQNGKLWDSRIDAQEAMRARGEMGRRGDSRQGDRPAFRERSSFKPSFKSSGFGSAKPEWKPRSDAKPEWKPKSEGRSFGGGADREKPEWKPKAEDRSSSARSDREKPEWKPKTEGRSSGARSDRTEWKPKTEGRSFGARSDREKPEWKAKSDSRPDWKSKSARPRSESPGSSWKPKRDTGDRAPWKPKSEAGARSEWKPKSDRAEFKPRSDSPRPAWKGKPRSEGLEWTPKSGHTGPKPEGTEKRKWVPKEEYKKSMGIEAKRDSKWRPGGEHKDPKQKYKDAKKAKWGRFKSTIKKRWESKGGKKRSD